MRKFENFKMEIRSGIDSIDKKEIDALFDANSTIANFPRQSWAQILEVEIISRAEKKIRIEKKYFFLEKNDFENFEIEKKMTFHQKNHFFQVNILLEKIDFSDEKIKIFDFKKNQEIFFFDIEIFKIIFLQEKIYFFDSDFFFWSRNFLYFKDLCSELSGKICKTLYQKKYTSFPLFEQALWILDGHLLKCSDMTL